MTLNEDEVKKLNNLLEAGQYLSNLAHNMCETEELMPVEILERYYVMWDNKKLQASEIIKKLRSQ